MTGRVAHARLVLGGLFELMRYDVVHTWLKRPVLRLPAARRLDEEATSPHLQAAVCDAVRTAGCLYWKPVLCLQHSVCLVRLLRRHGVRARLTIGYRTAPFFSHAWVEVDGRVVNDSPAYRSRLQILHTL